MKKLSLSIMSALLFAALVILPNTARAQDDPKAQLDRDWYAACYPQKEQTPKCLQMCEELLAKNPQSTYAKTAQGLLERNKLSGAWEAFQTALKDYYAGPPDAAKLEKLFSTGDEFLKIQPNYPDVVVQQALAGSNAAITEAYKNLDKVKGYAEKALTVFEPTTTPNKEQMDQARWTQFRELIMATENQFLAFRQNQPGGDPQKALEYLGKSIAVKSQSPGQANIGWKDPTNYWLRSTIINNDYIKLSKQYSALPDDTTGKTGEPGKALLKQIGEVVDKLLGDYARVIATATKPEYKQYQDAARETFKVLWDFRTGKPELAADYQKNYLADPTIPDVAVPAKAEETAPPAGPPTGGTAVKLSGSGSSGAPGSTSANGTKANGKKPAAKPATKKPARRKR